MGRAGKWMGRGRSGKKREIRREGKRRGQGKAKGRRSVPAKFRTTPSTCTPLVSVIA